MGEERSNAMKRLLSVLLVGIIVLSITGCNNNTNKNNPDVEDTKANAESSLIEKQTNNTNKTDVETTNKPDTVDPVQSPDYAFSSPEELLNALDNGNRGAEIRECNDDKLKMYYSMIDRFERGEIKLKYPVIDGYDKDFLTQDVTLFTEGSFNMPWIWYRRWYDNKIMVVQITYLNDELLEYSKTHSAWDVCRYVLPTVSSREELEEGMYVEEKTLETEYGEIFVMYRESKDIARSYLLFITDGMMVQIFGSPEEVNFELVNKLHLLEVGK